MAGPLISLSHTADDCSITEHQNAFRVVNGDHSAHSRKIPRFFALVGGDDKSVTLQQLLGASYLCDQTHGQVILHELSLPGFDAKYDPIFALDCELHVVSPNQSHPVTPTFTDRVQPIMHWNTRPKGKLSARHQRNLGCHVYAQCLTPFVDMFVYFSNDLGGLRGVGDILAEHILSSHPPKMPAQSLPVALVLMYSTSSNFDAEIMKKTLLERIAYVTGARKIVGSAAGIPREYFRDIHVLNLNPKHSQSSRLKKVSDRLVLCLKESRAMRCLSGRDFSSRHFGPLFSCAIDHFVSGQVESFSTLNASRAGHNWSSDLSYHLTELSTLAPSETHMRDFIPGLVASALYLDSLPPGMHFFPEQEVYDHFYRGIVEELARKVTPDSTETNHLLNRIESRFKQLYAMSKETRSINTAQTHAECLRSLAPYFEQLQSNKTCLCCLMRMPEKVLSCGHAFCDVCVKIYGQRSASNYHAYVLHFCCLCGKRNEHPVYRFMPPTAGPRILTLDGGGTKGVIPLTFLIHIEDRMSDLQCPLRDHFDLVCGTSSGGLIILGLYYNRWKPVDCLGSFERLAHQIFQRRSKSSHVLVRAKDFVSSYLADCLYDSSTTEEALNFAFRSDVQMFNPINDDTKIAVTTTTAENNSARLLANYNGGSRLPESGYKLLRASHAEHDVTVSEAARCTSAAPWFFKPKVLKHLGTFQDGGLRYNNPLRVALWESRALWPAKSDPDFALSLGTGTDKSPSLVKGVTLPNVRLRSLSRIFRAFMSTMDGESTWDEVVRSLEPAQIPRYHRLNVDVGPVDASIDDLSIMNDMKSKAKEYIMSGKHLDTIRDRLLASMFYFELDGQPHPLNGSFACSGKILCRLNLPPSGRRNLYQMLQDSRAYFLVNGRCVPCVEHALMSHPPFKRSIKFQAQSLDDIIGISIARLTVDVIPISGLPKSVRHFIKLQKLDSWFGRPDHSQEEKELPEIPRKRKRSI